MGQGARQLSGRRWVVFELRGQGGQLTTEEREAVARAASLTGGEGGFGVPSPIDPTLIMTGSGSSNPFRQISKVVTITNDNWLGLAVGAATASWDGEAGEVSDDTPTWVQPSIDAEKAQIFIPASIEITQDYPGFAADVAEIFKEAKDDAEATVFATGAGSGSDQPLGVVTAVAAVTASRVAATTDNSFGVEDVYALLEALPPKHRRMADWVSSLQIMNLVRQFATANNYHGFTVDLTAEGITQMLGKAYHEASAMDTAITTGDDDVLLVGNFNRYVIVDRVGFNIELIPHLFATGNNRPSGQRGFFGYWRVGGGATDTNAFRVLRV